MHAVTIRAAALILALTAVLPAAPASSSAMRPDAPADGAALDEGSAEAETPARATRALAAPGSPEPASAEPASPEPASPEPASPEPIFVDLSGKTVRVSDHRGHVVLLNFWATWCGPCRTEMPEIQKLHESLGPRGLRVIGGAANGRTEGALVQQVMGERGATFPTWLWVSAKDMRHYGVGPGIPATVLLDREGRVVHRHAGMVTAAALRAIIEPLLEAPGD